MIKINIGEKSQPRFVCTHCNSEEEPKEVSFEHDGLYFFRLECTNCGTQWVPNNVPEFGGFGVLKPREVIYAK